MKKYLLLVLILVAFSSSCKKDVFFIGSYNVILNGSFSQNGNTVNQHREFSLELISKTNDSVEFAEKGNSNNHFKIAKGKSTVNGDLNIVDNTSGYYYGPVSINGDWYNEGGNLLIIATYDYIAEIPNSISGQIETFTVKGTCEISPE